MSGFKYLDCIWGRCFSTGGTSNTIVNKGQHVWPPIQWPKLELAPGAQVPLAPGLGLTECLTFTHSIYFNCSLKALNHNHDVRSVDQMFGVQFKSWRGHPPLLTAHEGPLHVLRDSCYPSSTKKCIYWVRRSISYRHAIDMAHIRSLKDGPIWT